MSALEDQVQQEQADYEEGKTVEDLAEEPQPEEPTPPMQVPLEGFGDTITTTPGGDRPKSSSVALRGGKLSVEGEFKKGDLVELYVQARIGTVAFVDTHDKYGTVTGTERQHIAVPVAVKRLASSEE